MRGLSTIIIGFYGLLTDGPTRFAENKKTAGVLATCGDILLSGLSQPQVRRRWPKVKKVIPGRRGVDLQTDLVHGENVAGKGNGRQARNRQAMAC
jgi:hypothetical protein